MDDFRESAVYEGDLPVSHSDLLEYRDEDSPELYATIGQMGGDVAKYTAAGTAGGFLAFEGLQRLGVADLLGQTVEMTAALTLPAAGAVMAGRKGLEKVSEKREDSRQRKRHWRQAQALDEVEEEDFEQNLLEEDYVVVRDNLLGDGEPLERTGRSAAALYSEAEGLYDTQYFQDLGTDFPGVDYQLSLVEDDLVIRSFVAGRDIVQDAEETFHEKELSSFIRQNSEEAVSLEEHR